MFTHHWRHIHQQKDTLASLIHATHTFTIALIHSISVFNTQTTEALRLGVPVSPNRPTASE